MPSRMASLRGKSHRKSTTSSGIAGYEGDAEGASGLHPPSSFLEQVLGESNLRRSFSKKSITKMEEELRKQEMIKHQEQASSSNNRRGLMKNNSMGKSEEDLMKQSSKQSGRSTSGNNGKGNGKKSRRKSHNGPSKSRSRSEPRSRLDSGDQPPPAAASSRRRSRSGGKPQRMVGHGVGTKQQQQQQRQSNTKPLSRSPSHHHNQHGNRQRRPRTNSLKENKPQHKQSHHHHRSSHNPTTNQLRSKSVPPIPTYKKSIYVDQDELRKCPVSPVASVDSSWRHELTKKTRAENRKQQQQQRQQRAKAKRERRRTMEKKQQQVDRRSKSCKPSLAHGHSKNGRKGHAETKDGNKDEHNEEDSVGEGALVPYHANVNSRVNDSLAYNLGERDVDDGGGEPNINSQRTPGDDTKSSLGEDHDPLGTSYRTGEETWRGRAPEPVMSVYGGLSAGGTTYGENVSPGTYGNDTATVLSPRSGGAPDPPTMASDVPTYQTDPATVNRRAPSPDSFAERGSNGSKTSDESSRMATTTSSNSQGEGSIFNDEGDDESSVGSLFDDAPSTTTNEKKYAAPPLHSAVRSLKPTSRSRKPKNEKKLNNATTPSSSHRPTRSARNKGVKKEQPKIAKVINVGRQPIKTNDIPNDIDNHNDLVSELTMPAALRRAPPLHSRIRSKKPRSSSHRNGAGNYPSPLSPLRESKEDQDVLAAAVNAAVEAAAAASSSAIGPMTGNNINLHPASNSTSKGAISELTMPVALCTPYAQAFLQRSTKQQPSEQKLQQSSGVGGGVPSSSLEKALPPLRPMMNHARPPPPRRPLIPPPPRHQVQQHHHQRATAPPMKHPPNVATANTMHESMTDMGASFSSNISNTNGQQQQQSISPPSGGGGGRMSYQYNRNGSLLSLKSNNDTQPMETAVQLSDAAAQLLSMQIGGGSRNNNIKSSSSKPIIESDGGNSLGRQQQAHRSSPPSHIRSSSAANVNLLNPNSNRQRCVQVENMPYTDEFHNMGMYTGEMNEYGQLHGKGRMKSSNGVFFEGTWTNGVRDGLDATQRERLLSGFTSWKGGPPPQSRMNGTNNTGKQSAHGMIWIDKSGQPGRYTGDLNHEGLAPHGRGVMCYDYGLIAEGEWVNGTLVTIGALPPSRPSLPPGMAIGSGVSPPTITGGASSVVFHGGIGGGGPMYTNYTMMDQNRWNHNGS